ncbi:uncharacterized protein LOC126992169 [Eriocheir sinensis]|uniref:uncharacterized protein LOC126992169 n=1 Tax=Eriocheir sinensis TaxID=95602 RepID=UPI0021CA1873|nr:uncharacterized protein LOC126992169 [Eriocheir sinensis]
MLPPVKGGQIFTWIDTHRTRFCKLTTPKSGSGRPVLSVREKWIFEKFSFLKEHIRCVPQRQSQMFGMQPDQQETQGEQGEEAEEEVILEELEDAVVVATPSITVAPTVFTPSTSTTPAGKRKRTPTDDGALIEKVLGHLSDSRDVRQRLQRLEHRTPQQHKVHAFYEYMECLTWILFSGGGIRQRLWNWGISSWLKMIKRRENTYPQSRSRPGDIGQACQVMGDICIILLTSPPTTSSSLNTLVWMCSHALALPTHLQPRRIHPWRERPC